MTAGRQTSSPARLSVVRLAHGGWYLFGVWYGAAVHLVIMAAPGAGKDQVCVLPALRALLQWSDEHLVIVDPKRELREGLYPYLREDDRVFIYSFYEATRLSSALPVTLEPKDVANAAAFLMPTSGGESKHFDDTARRLFVQLEAGLAEDLRRRPTLLEIYDHLKDPDLFEDLCGRYPRIPRVATNDREWGSVVSTAQTHLEQLRWPEVRRVFDADADVELPFGPGGRSVVFVEPSVEDAERTEKWVAMVLDQLHRHASRDGDPRGAGSKRGTKFVVDEAASYMRLEKIPRYLDIGRGNMVQMMYVLQNWPQLADVLGREKAKRAWGSTELRVAGAGTDRETAERISELSGRQRVTYLGPRQRNWERRREQAVRPLVNPEHITGLAKDENKSEWALVHGSKVELLRVRRNQYFYARAGGTDPAWEYLIPCGMPGERQGGCAGPEPEDGPDDDPEDGPTPSPEPSGRYEEGSVPPARETRAESGEEEPGEPELESLEDPPAPRGRRDESTYRDPPRRPPE